MENKTNIIYRLCFRIPPMNPTDITLMFETIKKKNDSELLTALHFQCDTFFQHTLNFTFSYFNKKTDTTYF